MKQPKPITETRGAGTNHEALKNDEFRTQIALGCKSVHLSDGVRQLMPADLASIVVSVVEYDDFDHCSPVNHDWGTFAYEQRQVIWTINEQLEPVDAQGDSSDSDTRVLSIMLQSELLVEPEIEKVAG
ncbi:MAG: DUF3768 domain-containing protein [Pseudomonadota bacterium]